MCLPSCLTDLFLDSLRSGEDKTIKTPVNLIRYEWEIKYIGLVNSIVLRPDM